MTTTGRQPLPDAAESLLAGWPAPAKSALEWEDLASRTVQAARDTAASPASATTRAEDDALFAPPLPGEDGEGSMAEEPAQTADEPGLLDIAKKVVAANAGASSKEIALAGLQAADAGRRDAPGVPPPRPPTRAEHEAQAVAGLMGRMTAPSRAPEPQPVRPVAVVRAAHHPVEAAAHSEVPAGGRAGSKKPWAVVTIGGVALSLAAAFALFVGSRHPGPELTAATQVADPPAVPAGAQPSAALVEPAAVEPAAQAAAAPTQNEALPQAEDRLKDDALAFRVGKTAAASNQIVLEQKAGARAPVAAAAPATKKSRALNDEMAQAVGAPAKVAPAPDPAPKIAQEDLPDRPTIGDAQAAAGPALMKARMCLAGQETGSQAKLTFGSDGRVKSVAISGPAAGTPAESCLRSQLSTARVPPFSEKSFSFSLTVRPP